MPTTVFFPPSPRPTVLFAIRLDFRIFSPSPFIPPFCPSFFSLARPSTPHGDRPAPPPLRFFDTPPSVSRPRRRANQPDDFFFSYPFLFQSRRRTTCLFSPPFSSTELLFRCYALPLSLHLGPRLASAFVQAVYSPSLPLSRFPDARCAPPQTPLASAPATLNSNTATRSTVRTTQQLELDSNPTCGRTV